MVAPCNTVCRHVQPFLQGDPLLLPGHILSPAMEVLLDLANYIELLPTSTFRSFFLPIRQSFANTLLNDVHPCPPLTAGVAE